MVGINVQLGAITSADTSDLRRFDSALVIADWPEHVPDTLAVLDAAGVPVAMWRFTQDPRTWPTWPGDYLKRCPWAVFANEPDLPTEAWPAWYEAAIYAWRHAGGRLVEPALSDESRYGPLGMERLLDALVKGSGREYDAVSCHVYPLGLGAANLAAVRPRLHGRPLFVSEYGIAGQQQRCLQQLAADGITEPTFIYTYRARDAEAQPQYDVAGVALLPVPQNLTGQPNLVVGQFGPVSSSNSGKEHHPMANVPELDQGWSKACWAYSVAECFDAAGYYVSPFDVYAQTKGQLLTLPGLPATFPELRAAINAAAAMTSARIKWLGPLGVINDPATFDQAVRDGWYVVAGVREADLQPGQDYGHYVVARKIDFDKDGTPELEIVDSYKAEDGGSDRYPLAGFHTAMADNWDPSVDAIAFQIAS